MTLLTTHNPIRPLPADTASELMRIFIDQDTDALLVGACLALLAQRVPEAHELAAFADALSEVAVPFPPVPEDALDTCGTGGDGSSTANLSTLAALLLPQFGVPIVKHGNRAATGVCGSADLLEALGYDLARASADLSADLSTRRFAFLFAPAYHPLLGRLREIRKRLGIPTIFNLLGPLLNPGLPPLQLLGVAREELTAPMAGALARRPSLRRAFVIHGKDAEGKGLDEASIEGPTTVLAVMDGNVAAPQVLVPRELGLTPPTRHALRVHDRAEALAVAHGLFGGSAHADFRPAVADAVALQAALGLHLHRDLGLEGLAETLREVRSRLDQGFTLPFTSQVQS
ncbi:anthranilate phosphoribosyltransferase [Geothrix sp. PMB-07]|uniref:anthranilate phosphoribosyltransferase n=1 Tax=Geothrix sp. PMB-07 TaxID=3068640 RepID=UPI00274114F3|nr:anthranilate phosphoribosyltransferase [Geothrix sp. PMB-07]WLT30151.1 anthranilate phosphoribosyltransferase [Geothrix sp. PMB-07]